MTTRRAILRATASGWLLSQLGEPPKKLPGRIVGATHAVGHLLRSPDPLAERRAGPRARCDVVVVGAGVAGLSAAWRLAPAALDVRVLELEPFVGGTSTWGEDGVVQHPWGAHYLPAPNPEARATVRLLEEMGVVTGWDPLGLPRLDGRVLCHAPEERLFYRGAWHPGLVPQAALERADLDALSRFSSRVGELTDKRGRDGRFAFQIPIAESSRDPELLELDRMSMADWMTREGFDAPFVRWYVRYATLDDFGGEPEDVSAWAGLHYFSSRKLHTPELEGSHFLVWPEGNGRLVKALLEGSRAQVTKGALVVSVEETKDGVAVHAVDAATGEHTTLEARAAVLAVPSFIARRLAPSAAERLPERASSPWLVANLHLTRPLDPEQHTWDSVLHGAEGLGYVDASHQLTPPAERTVVTYFRAFGQADVRASRQHLLAATWESLADAVLRDLRPAHPDLFSRLERMDVVVWGHAMPRPRPGFLGERPFEAEQTLSPRVAWAHTDVSGMALFEEAQRAGVRAAELVAPRAGVELGPSWV
ncbi:MAG: FAD-dependent oxidoreductase [Myxococcales bacterium]|nr:FAD-dependent oxidoreductase [Myxococcales bacterium]